MSFDPAKAAELGRQARANIAANEALAVGTQAIPDRPFHEGLREPTTMGQLGLAATRHDYAAARGRIAMNEATAVSTKALPDQHLPFSAGLQEPTTMGQLGTFYK